MTSGSSASTDYDGDAIQLGATMKEQLVSYFKTILVMED